ncbi:g5675 [Coccomyxa viridis]|uniref:G5675 protein n=1 Tax=Coccomyxa viridis TaxID=1274662 RepID=A0ABP1FXD3_9CHLO
MHRNAIRRAFRPPNFIEKPQPEKSKVHESQNLTTTSKQIVAQEEETDKSHSSLGIIAEPGIGSPAITMPQPLPDVHIEQSSAVPGASLPLPGQLAMSGPCALPSGGAPLLDCDIIHRIQAALIPKQIPQTAETSGKGLHDKLDGIMSRSNRSGCNLPGQWLAHGNMADVPMPKLDAPQKPAATSPAPSAAQPGQQSTAMTVGTENAQDPFSPLAGSTPAKEVGREQLPWPPQQQAGGRKLVQKRLDLQQAGPVSLNSPGAEQRPAAKECDGLHSTMLTQLELQDEEMEEVLRSPEKQLGEVMRHPASLLGITLDMAFLKSVCNV